MKWTALSVERSEIRILLIYSTFKLATSCGCAFHFNPTGKERLIVQQRVVKCPDGGGAVFLDAQICSKVHTKRRRSVGQRFAVSSTKKHRKLIIGQIQLAAGILISGYA